MIDQKSLIKRIEGLLKTEPRTSWEDHLFNMGIWSKFENLYSDTDCERSNIIVAFLIFAYSGHCNMVHLHKDRIENKIEILTEIGALESDIDDGKWNFILLNKSIIDKSLLSNDEVSEEEERIISELTKTIKWYLNWQKDSDWSNWIKSKEFVSINMSYATEPPSETMDVASKSGKAITIKTPDNIISGTAVRKAQLLQRCMVIDKQAKDLGEKIRQKYSDRDTIIEQEMDSHGIDLELNPMRFEDRLRMHINKQFNSKI